MSKNYQIVLMNVRFITITVQTFPKIRRYQMPMTHFYIVH